MFDIYYFAVEIHRFHKIYTRSDANLFDDVFIFKVKCLTM